MTNTTTATAHLTDSRNQDAFNTMKKCVTLFGVVSAIVLATVTAMAFTGHETTSFMWIRGAILLAVAPVIHRMAVHASRGSIRAFDRVRTLSTITPIAIIGVDLIPGLCPAWYAVMQGLSALALIGVAFITRSAALSAAFAEKTS
ncbi:hypothetical protein GCM10023322_00560 [Rugosimonospora acidiphila]|uniref:Uncharacterized protein n=1 Tax=Rugosimonospora acidiphila TaxID=556531 RepID=A0ABP9RFW7_9ACTN